MNLARPFIHRPVASLLLAVAILLGGLLAWRLLPVAPLPQVEFPMIVVNASLPGASPESMAATVATPLERALGSIAGIQSLSSDSRQGATNIRIEFDLDRNIDEAARDVQAAINAARNQLPAGMPGNPSFRKVNPSQSPIVALALSSPNLPPSRLYDLASTVIAQKLAQVAGVGEVSVEGSSLPAVRVQLNPGALAHHGIALDEVRSAIVAANALRPLGALEDADHRWDVRLSEPLRHAADYLPLIVREQDGAPVRLADVATVTDSVENRYTDGFHNDNAAVILQVSRQPGANIVSTLDAIDAQLPALRTLLPADATLTVVMDRSPGIRTTLREGQLALLASMTLVVLVVWAFLGSARAALIPGAAVAVSLVGSVAAMYLLGFSMNNLSMMALILGASLVVDDAIVVLEDVQRHIERGLTPMRAALRSAREVGFTLLAMNLALMVVFVSILFMGGVIERLFREFSLTLVAAMLISLLLSLTFTPSLCARLLKPAAERRPHALARAVTAAYEDLREVYGRSLSWALEHRRLVMLMLAGVVALNVWLYVSIPKTVLPQQDTGQLRGFIRGDDGFSFQVMQPKIEAYRRLLLQDPAVQDVTGTAGGGGGVSNARVSVRLKPKAERGEPARAVGDRLRKKAPPVPGAMMMIFPDQDIRLGSNWGNSENELLLLSDQVAPLREWSRKVKEKLTTLPELVDVDSFGDEGTQQVHVEIDREAARRLGVDMRTIASVLNNSFSQRQVATLYDDLNQYRVVMELEPGYTSSPTVLDQVQVIAADGRRVPLSAFSSYHYGAASDNVHHDKQFASTSIGYSLAEGVTEQQGLAAINRAMGELMLPSNIIATPGGATNGVTTTLARQPLLLLGVLIAVFFVLGILYESALQPLTILSTLPSAGVGALLALRFSNTEFSLVALLGLFLLIGLVMRNAIMMVDFALGAQRRGKLAPAEAIHRAALMRLRPILMVNIAALLGALPLLLGAGEGSELRRPLGITVIGGLVMSQLLTLFSTPVVYLYVEKLRAWLARARRPAAERAGAFNAADASPSGSSRQ
ncbi:MAG: efflux RND transporter permease subunit [Steroidobacteraceae bacterium]